MRKSCCRDSSHLCIKLMPSAISNKPEAMHAYIKYNIYIYIYIYMYFYTWLAAYVFVGFQSAHKKRRKIADPSAMIIWLDDWARIEFEWNCWMPRPMPKSQNSLKKNRGFENHMAEAKARWCRSMQTWSATTSSNFLFMPEHQAPQPRQTWA